MQLEQRLASLPEPKLVNLDAVIAFSPPTPRRFVEGGIGFRAPPLSYPAGIRLLAVRAALRDLLKAGEAAPTQFVEAVRGTVIRLIARSIRPGLLRRLRGGWLRVFRVMETEELEALLTYLIYVPDASLPPPEPKEPVTVDLMDALTAFVQSCPGWTVTPFRWRFWRPRAPAIPVSWAAYIHGCRHLARLRAREDLRMTRAFRIAQGADETEFAKWKAEEIQYAGWANG